ncbi:MAG: hypothetical protein ACK4M9_11325 [Anaerobacillus sp.]
MLNKSELLMFEKWTEFNIKLAYQIIINGKPLLIKHLINVDLFGH